MEALIPLLQIGIWIIFAIMGVFIGFYFYLIKNQSTYNSNANSYEKYNNNKYDDSLNTNHEDDGPIQNL